MTLLQANGFDVTQATVSRDIKELQLVKTQSKNGQSKYIIGNASGNKNSGKFYSIFSQSVVSVEYAGNMSVIKCFAGTANAAAAAIDGMHFPNILGSIAGDDTMFILCKTEFDAKSFKEEIENMLSGDK